ncbi:MAG TPA: hypothetical protein VFO61_02575 [Alphaproteobacteria bacterium]|nr:hypothetical protein [Alphaproteobacteria bacterium]
MGTSRIIVNFVCDFPGEFVLAVGESYPKLLESPIFYKIYASVRLRCLLPLATVGHHMPARLISYRTLFTSAERFGPDDRFVLFKVGSSGLRDNPDLARAMIAFAEERRFRFIYDTCDPAHADSNPSVAQVQALLLRQADLVTCVTAELATDLATITERPIRVIDDTIDCPPAPPRSSPGDPVRIVWFGWMSGLRFSNLENQLAHIQTALPDRRFECLVLSQDLPAEWFTTIDAFLRQKGKGDVRVVHRRWDLPEAWDIIADHDIALIPHDLEADGSARFKSHNRLTTAIRRGVFAAASPIPAYRPLSDYCWLGDNLAEGVAWALAHPEEARARITAGQARIDALYGPEAVGARWIEVLTEAVARA